ncbi:MAG: SpoIIE family protein phosphatase, partial [Calditrichaeota bacterium]|nr:SpoIIE family protein phosphatase [Calditrichota bacterium]
INDIPHHRQFRTILEWKSDARSILGAPMFSNRGQLMGILYATKAKEYTFDIDDVSLIQGVANQAAIAMENASLLKESIERERMEQELKIARDVQLKLLPQILPKIENFDLEAFCLSAYEVGGDYYDFFYYADGYPGLIIGDVSGKGTSAALYMAEFKGIIQTLAKHHKTPYSLTCDINKTLYPNIERHTFISAIVAKIDPKKEKIIFARAGHTPVLFCSKKINEPQNILTRGIGIGLDKGEKFNSILEEYSLSLQGNGTMILYTDGVTEARNSEGSEFGEERLASLLKECNGYKAEEIKERLVNSVVNFCGSTPLHDDMTFIILQNCTTQN